MHVRARLIEFVHMLSLSGLIFRIGTHHCNHYERTNEHMNIKKRKVLHRRNFTAATKLRFITTQHWTSKEFTGFNVTKLSIHSHTYPKMFDWERTYILCSLEIHWKICVFILRANVCVLACVPFVIHDVPKRPSYSLVNEEKLLFSLGLIILFKHPVVSLGSCTSTTVCICWCYCFSCSKSYLSHQNGQLM